jgi:hypothetical protein
MINTKASTQGALTLKERCHALCSGAIQYQQPHARFACCCYVPGREHNTAGKRNDNARSSGRAGPKLIRKGPGIRTDPKLVPFSTEPLKVDAVSFRESVDL